MPAPVSLERNPFELPEALLADRAWCCVIPDPAVEDRLRAGMIDASLAKESFAKRVAFRAALPFVSGRLRREFRSAFFPLHAHVRLTACKLAPQACVDIVEAMRDLDSSEYQDSE